jgi:DNA repair protein RadD
MTITLRPRQQVFIDAIRAEFDVGHESVMAVAPTGFGKTVCFSYIAENARQLGNRTFILVHRKELVRQTSRSLHQNGIPHGVVAAGYPELNMPIQVCSVQTLARRLNKYRVPDLIVIDEAHHSAAQTYLDVFEWAAGKAVRLGVTATPIRSDGKGFAHLYTSMVLGPDTWTLISEGWLAKPVLYAPPIEEIDLSDVRTLAGEYNRADLAVAMDKQVITGCAVEHYKRILPHSPTAVAFCVSVAHAEHVAGEFRAAGIPFEAIDGSMDDFERSQILGRVADGTTRGLASCNLVDEGFDLPKIEVVIDLSPTKSLARLLQRLGRALRICQGKTEAVFFDHVGNSERHWEAIIALMGIDPSALQWSLEGRKKRASTAKGGTLATCKRCFLTFPPADLCPGCGFQMRKPGENDRKIEQVEGELVKIEPQALIKQSRRPTIQRLERA